MYERERNICLVAKQVGKSREVIDLGWISSVHWINVADLDVGEDLSKYRNFRYNLIHQIRDRILTAHREFQDGLHP